MRRLLIGLGSFIFLLVTAILVVPFFLPKDKIKEQVVQQIDNRFGWRVRLDGPVSLSLFPRFSLSAEDIGLSGEAGADGIEFARASRMDFGLAWSGLLSGKIQVTGITLDEPDIYLEVDRTGATTWQPRRNLLEASDTTPAPEPSAADTSQAVESAGTGDGSSGSALGYLKNIGVDRLDISNGKVTYKDANQGQSIELRDLNLVVRAGDLSSDVNLESNFLFQEVPLSVSGTVTNPIALANGDQVPVSLVLSSGDNTISMTGDAGQNPVRATLAIEAEGSSIQALALLAGQELAVDPGAFKMDAQVSASEVAVAISDLHLLLGDLSLGGAADADLSSAEPHISGRLVMKDGSIANLLALAGQDLVASGVAGADLAFETRGTSSDALLAALDLKGTVSVEDGEIGGLGLASAVGGDPDADKITDLSLTVELEGIEQPISMSGALAWRGEGFSVTGEANTALLMAGMPAPVSVAIKGNRLGAGFDGQTALSGETDGAVRIETADLRGLMAWLGQPIGAGGGLKTFKASGIFGVHGESISFEETRFTLDETSGEANGKVELSAKPKVTANLALRDLVLDPYLDTPSGQGSTSSEAGSSNSTPAAPSSSSRPSTQVASGSWSSSPIDFSGLKAVDVDFKATAEKIRWDKISIGRSALNAVIKDGVLTADLQELSLYDGRGSGQVVLNGVAADPAVSATFSLADLNSYPLLRDTADFEWIEGKVAIELDVEASGASERALVQGLTGTASYEFADGAIRGINIPKMLRGLSVETLLGWQENPSEKTDFSSLSASFQIQNGIAKSDNLSLVGPLVRMSGGGTTDMPAKTLDWRVEPRIVATLEGQAPMPRRKGEDKKLAGLGVPIVIKGSWDDPQIYPDIAGILNDPEAAYKQLQETGGDLIAILKGEQNAPDALAETANEIINQATGGRTQIDVQKVIEGDVNDEDVLKAVEEGFGLPAGLLGNAFGRKNNN